LQNFKEVEQATLRSMSTDRKPLPVLNTVGKGDFTLNLQSIIPQ